MKRIVMLASLLFFACSGHLNAQQLFQVKEVIDGDSIVVHYRGKSEEVHMLGVRAPTPSRSKKPANPAARQAKTFTNNILSRKAVRLEFGDEQRNNAGKLIAYVHIPANKVTAPPSCMVKSGPREYDFNASLISCGYAHVQTGIPFARKAQYQKLEKKARSANLGIWKPKASPAKRMKKQVKKEAVKKQYFVGDKRNRVYHKPDCRKVNQIKPGKRIEFSNKKEARKAGYKPCKSCNP